jgi:uncharacterized membrane protein SpoIIM required for sporulation
MIIDVPKFVKTERAFWEELESVVNRFERDPLTCLDMEELKRFHYLYARVSADLSKLATFAFEKEVRAYLEDLVARAYAEIHETRRIPHRFSPFEWLRCTLPHTFRAHILAFRVALAATMIGAMFGAGVMLLDPNAKDAVMPFRQLLGDPGERVVREESTQVDHLSGRKAQGAAFYITHNTKIALFVLSAGITLGVVTLILLFYNGVVLGAICLDYVLSGETTFLVGWLLPHGSVEIPAILVAGQAGLVLGAALIGWGRKIPLADRMRAVAPDLVTLVFGVVLMLGWAALVEAFFSQYHEPVIPYSIKIGVGIVELALLVLFFSRCGRKTRNDANDKRKTTADQNA